MRSFGELPDPLPGTAGPADCADPVTALRTMFVDMVQAGRIARGQEPAQRPVFLKPHGVAHARFEVRPDLPEELRVGLFRGSRYDAWVRFSSDTLPTRPDLKSTCGIGIKLFGVPGEKLLDPERDATTHDLLLQNFDVFFVDTATDMCEFTRAGVVNHDYDAYLAEHPRTKQLLDDMAQYVPSVLEATYWSGLPYRFGASQYVKYKLAPVASSAPQTGGRNPDDPSYLHAELRERLLAGEAALEFSVQLRTDADAMPLDRATVRWSEELSLPVPVATLTFPRQDIDARSQAAYGENLAYNPWHALAEHEPAGSIAEARRTVYQASAELRRNTNGVPVGEPDRPRPLASAPVAVDTTIVRAAIHPAIGVARIGNSESEFFLAPEVTEPEPGAAGSFKDASGAMKRQAARFRVYGYNAAGAVVTELTSDSANIAWTVHLANTKAAWYQFQVALDIPEAADLSGAEPSLLRNATVADRSVLTIDPGPRCVRGANKNGAGYAFDTGEFYGTKVYLGELQTDESGRLIVLGGRGVSASYTGAPPTTFANNDGWHDDTADGPVTAKVSINGQEIPVEPAWVVVAPPDYAPAVKSVRTMHDLLFDAYVQAGSLPYPEQVSFSGDVLPILTRLCGLEWVNHGFAAAYGWFGRQRWIDPDLLKQLSSDAPEYDELRRQVWTACRDWVRDGESPVPWPWVYGDSMSLPPVSARQHVTLSPTQYRLLERWANGDFLADYDPAATPPRILDQVPLSGQPAMLDRAALEFCLADAFHPGCEMTWPMRHPTLYMSPFRIRHRPAGEPSPAYGSQLTPDIATSIGGPLYAQGPGDLTRWMAVPWQTDTASCRSGYTLHFGPVYDPYLPTFWPARVPNHVLTEADYQVVVDPSRSPDERRAAFERRAVWLRFLGGPGYQQQLETMISSFGKLGVVEARSGPSAGDGFPATLMVESEVGFPAEGVPVARNLVTLHIPDGVPGPVVEARVGAIASVAPMAGEDVAVGSIDKVQRFRRHR